MMNWEAVGAVAEMIGGIAVLVTLIYLALQLRQKQFSVVRQTAILLIVTSWLVIRG
jgi:hypothetical protein